MASSHVAGFFGGWSLSARHKYFKEKSEKKS
jgi:hypothetical protein